MKSISTQNELDSLSEEKIVLDFWADWCMPCKAFAPVFSDAGNESSALFVKVDVDQAQELADKFGIRSIPTVVYLKNGKEVMRHVGSVNKETLLKNVESL